MTVLLHRYIIYKYNGVIVQRLETVATAICFTMTDWHEPQMKACKRQPCGYVNSKSFQWLSQTGTQLSKTNRKAVINVNHVSSLWVKVTLAFTLQQYR